MIRITRRSLLLGASAVSVAAVAGSRLRAAESLEILASLPNMAFPFFVHMMKAIHAQADKHGEVTIVESDGQGSSPKQTADVETALVRGVKGIVISPNEVDAMAPAIKGAIDAGVPVVTIDRRVENVEGILAHVGADNVKGGEAQGELVMKLFPNGAKVMNLQGQPGASPAIDRNKGLHNVLDKASDKYKFVFEQTANFARDKGLAVTEAGLAGIAEPPDVIVAANDDMALGAMEAVKARNLSDKIAILGFDALPEALAAVRDGTLTATIEQFPGGQSSQAVDILIDKIRNGKDPASNLVLLTPVAITKENLDQAERLGEVT
jgi:inositol transport system substrate-binding protein